MIERFIALSEKEENLAKMIVDLPIVFEGVMFDEGLSPFGGDVLD